MKKDATKREVPKFDELMNPTLQALKRLGGSASIDELVPEIVKFLGLPSVSGCVRQSLRLELLTRARRDEATVGSDRPMVEDVPAALRPP